MDVLEPGSNFLGYTIVRELGRGGVGVVYHAKERSGLERDVALKFIQEPDADSAARFQREMRTMAKLRGPHILPIYDAGVEGQVAWMALQYVEGGDLSDRLKRPLSIPEGVKLLQGIADGLDYMGARGYVHRDLKPANVLLSEEGEPFLADFGLAKPTKPTTASAALTVDQNVRGTPGYMAPEQATAQQVDRRTDIYALGIICFEWLVGTRPFDRETQFQTLLAHVSEPVPLEDLRSRFSEETADVIVKVLAKNPSDRFDTATHFVDALRTALTDADSSAKKPTKLRSSTWPSYPKKAPRHDVHPAAGSAQLKDDSLVIPNVAKTANRLQSATPMLELAFGQRASEIQQTDRNRLPSILIGGVAIVLLAVASVGLWTHFTNTRMVEVRSLGGVVAMVPASAEQDAANALSRLDAIAELRKELQRLDGRPDLLRQFVIPTPLDRALFTLAASESRMRDQLIRCRSPETCIALKQSLASPLELDGLTPRPLAHVGEGYLVPESYIEVARQIISEILHNDRLRATYAVALGSQDGTYDLAKLRSANDTLIRRIEAAKDALQRCRADCSDLVDLADSAYTGKSLDEYRSESSATQKTSVQYTPFTGDESKIEWLLGADRLQDAITEGSEIFERSRDPTVAHQVGIALLRSRSLHKAREYFDAAFAGGHRRAECSALESDGRDYSSCFDRYVNHIVSADSHSPDETRDLYLHFLDMDAQSEEFQLARRNLTDLCSEGHWHECILLEMYSSDQPALIQFLQQVAISAKESALGGDRWAASFLLALEESGNLRVDAPKSIWVQAGIMSQVSEALASAVQSKQSPEVLVGLARDMIESGSALYVFEALEALENLRGHPSIDGLIAHARDRLEVVFGMTTEMINRGMNCANDKEYWIDATPPEYSGRLSVGVCKLHYN